MANANKAYEKKMTLKEDLKIPSNYTYNKAVTNVISKNRKLAYEGIENFLKKADEESWYYAQEDGKEGMKLWKEYVDMSMDVVDRLPMDEAISRYAMSFGVTPKLKEAVIKELKKDGYNAMSDKASIWGNNAQVIEGIEPLIVFDSKVMNVDEVREISKEEEKQAEKDYRKWVSKARQNKNSNNWG